MDSRAATGRGGWHASCECAPRVIAAGYSVLSAIGPALAPLAVLGAGAVLLAVVVLVVGLVQERRELAILAALSEQAAPAAAELIAALLERPA